MSAYLTSQRGPIYFLRQHDLLKLMDISSHSSSFSQMCNSLSSSVTEGAMSIISSAYTNTKCPQRGVNGLLTLSTYIANKTGDSTEPCLTTEVTVNVKEKKSSHLTHEQHSENRFIIISSNWTGMFRFINSIKRA